MPHNPAPTHTCVEGKSCTQCGEFKPYSEFNKQSHRKDGLRLDCKDCRKAEYKCNYSSKIRAGQLKAKFGITLADYDQLLLDQNNGCAICGKSPEENGKRLAVDHNHTTGEVRGLLCSGCNTAIGLLGDNPATLRLATRYLEERGHYGDD